MVIQFWLPLNSLTYLALTLVLSLIFMTKRWRRCCIGNRHGKTKQRWSRDFRWSGWFVSCTVCPVNSTTAKKTVHRCWVSHMQGRVSLHIIPDGCWEQGSMFEFTMSLCWSLEMVLYGCGLNLGQIKRIPEPWSFSVGYTDQADTDMWTRQMDS